MSKAKKLAAALDLPIEAVRFGDSFEPKKWKVMVFGRPVRYLSTESADQIIAAHGSVDAKLNPARGHNLHNYRTGEYLRPATPAEAASSAEAAGKDGGSGVILVDGVSCYTV